MFKIFLGLAVQIPVRSVVGFLFLRFTTVFVPGTLFIVLFLSGPHRGNYC